MSSENEKSELRQQIELICIERGLDVEEVISAIEKAIAGAYRKEFGEKDNAYEADYDIDTGKYSVYKVVKIIDEEVTNPTREISLMEARLSDPSAQVGDVIKEVLVTEQDVHFGRIASQVAKQVLIYTVNNLRHTKVLKKFKDRIGEVVTVEVDCYKKGGYVVKLAQTTGFISKEDLLPIDRFKPGQLIKALIVDITEDVQRGSRIVLSRSAKDFVQAIIKQEVPEVEAGIVLVDKIVREPGNRTKILVSVNEDENQNIDPVGTILGRKNVRILNIMREISTTMQEKVDVVENQPDNFDEMVMDALEPAEIEKIEVGKGEEGQKLVNVFCFPEEASLAVGRRGANVRLASQLLDCEIKVNSLEVGDDYFENNGPSIMIDEE